MSKRREIRCFDYVNRPYDQVRDALKADATGVFQSASKSAASRARSVASELRVNLGGVEVSADISISVDRIEEHAGDVTSPPTTRLQLQWEASHSPRWFPIMRAEFSIYPLTATETQLDFLGRYEPPMGAIGGALDAVVGHRIAEASVHRFVSDVALYLRTKLATSGRE